MKIYSNVREYANDYKVGDILIFPPETEPIRSIEQFRKVNAIRVEKIDDKTLYLRSCLNSNIIFYYSLGRQRSLLVITKDELNKLKDYY